MSINLHVSGEDANVFEANLRGVMRLLARDELTKPAAPRDISVDTASGLQSQPKATMRVGKRCGAGRTPAVRRWGS